MQEEHDTANRSKPLTEVIAGFSLCMLAAAFGSILGPEWCRSWAIFGAFGLVSAVGLDVFRRAQEQLREKERDARMAVLAEQNLNKVVTDLESSSTIREALRRVQRDSVSTATRSPTGCTNSRSAAQRRVTITRLRGRSKTSENWMGDSFTGYTRDISSHGSSHGVGLAHSQHLERGPVLLTFELGNGEHVSFVADMLWCESQGDGQYFSGGKLLDVPNPEDVRFEMLQAPC